MKRQHLLCLATLGIATALFAQQPPATSPADYAVQTITQSPDPSAAVAAYTAAIVHTPDPVPVEHAYLHRMIDFNMPEMAFAQAQDLLRHDPHNSLARADIAYVQGRRGQVVDALTSIVQAVPPVDPNAPPPAYDPFVLRTAGQLVAWYDTRGDKSQIPPSLQQEIEQLRHALSSQDAYTQSYATARDTYQPPPATADSTTPIYTPGYTSSPQIVTSPLNYDNTYSYYPDTYYSNPYSYWNSGYGYGGYGYIPPIVVIPDHHHFHDGDHGHDHIWDHGHDHPWDSGHDHSWDHGHDGSSHMITPHGDNHFTPSHDIPSPHSFTVPDAPHSQPSSPHFDGPSHNDGGSHGSGNNSHGR